MFHKQDYRLKDTLDFLMMVSTMIWNVLSKAEKIKKLIYRSQINYFSLIQSVNAKQKKKKKGFLLISLNYFDIFVISTQF